MEQVSDLMTTAEVAAAFHVSDETVHRWVRQKKLSCIRLPSGTKRYRRTEVEAILNGDQTEAAA